MKIKISVIDFLPENGKHPIGKVDSQGKKLHVGDTVLRGSENWVIVYRYGDFLLKQIGMMAMIGLSDWTTVTKVNQITTGPDWLIIGMADEPLFTNEEITKYQQS